MKIKIDVWNDEGYEVIDYKVYDFDKVLFVYEEKCDLGRPQWAMTFEDYKSFFNKYEIPVAYVTYDEYHKNWVQYKIDYPFNTTENSYSKRGKKYHMIPHRDCILNSLEVLEKEFSYYLRKQKIKKLLSE